MIIASEIYRVVCNSKTNIFPVILDWIFMALTFWVMILMFEVSTSFRFNNVDQLQLLIGYFMWRIAGGIVVETSDLISEESKLGTLEQIYLSGQNLVSVLFVRSISVAISYLVRMLILGLLFLPFLELGGVSFKFELVSICILTLLGVIGFTLILSGIHLAVKAPPTLAFTLSTALLLLSGALTSLANIPILGFIAKALPLGMGVELMRFSLEGLLGLPNTGILIFVLTNLAYLALGYASVLWGERIAKRKGNFSQY
jgi:ABC-2 type transport system permease protein